MATSTCPKCTSTKFELKTSEIEGARFNVNLIQCASCGAVVGVVDYYNVPNLLEKLAVRLGVKDLLR